MADTQATDLPVLTTLASADVLYVVDASDTTDDPEGSSKQITAANLATGLTSIGGLATDAEVTTAVSTHAAVTSGVHGISAFGATLVDDADASAARTTLGLGSLATLSAITTTQITDGTIVDADINASAAIALSKLATDPLARANHTGSQTASTISDFAEAVDDEVATFLVAGANITLTHNDPGNSLTIAASGGGGGGGGVACRVTPSAGYWLGPSARAFTAASASSTAAVSHNRLVLGVIEVHYEVDIDQITMEISTAGDVSSVVRLGLWSDNGSGRPGTLLESGTAAADSIGAKAVAFTARTLTPGLYWVGHAYQNATPTLNLAYRAWSLAEGLFVHGYASDTGTSPNSLAMFVPGVTGAFSSSPAVSESPGATGGASSPARILLRVA